MEIFLLTKFGDPVSGVGHVLAVFPDTKKGRFSKIFFLSVSIPDICKMQGDNFYLGPTKLGHREFFLGDGGFLYNLR